MLLAATLLQAAVITVGPGGAHPSVAAALAAASPGDTVRVGPGVYAEHVIVATPVVLLGDAGAVLDGRGTGTVLTVTAPGVEVRGFTIRGSGASQSEEHSGLYAEGAVGIVVEDNRLDDVLFGIYLKACHGAVVRRNRVVGKPLRGSLRGDGIHLWGSHDGVVEDNDVRQVRDVAVWFSNGTLVRGNRVEDSRYGLHYMYSDRNTFERNTFAGNDVGAFIMYSSDIAFRENVFASSRGVGGRGLGFKDATRIVAERNVLIRNAVGLSLDNSPNGTGTTNTFRENLFAYNDVAVTMLPSVRNNVFAQNDFRDNVQVAHVTGGGTALANVWRGNFWSDYAGFDGDGDGVGDTPFVLERLSDDLFARHVELQVLALSPGIAAADVLGRVLPLLQPQPIVVDSQPRLRPGRPDLAGATRGHPLVALAILLAGIGAAALAWQLRTPFTGTA